ncbi:MAG: 3-deoxy-manno-octulosonate cytidylyltransferase [Cytophagaceae bacterium]
MNKKEFLGIIPARYGSSRLEGKPLLDIAGKTMIRRVYELCSEVFTHLYVATDDERIVNEVKSFGGKYVMTSIDHTNGTSRCLEASEKIFQIEKRTYDAIINIQGDEPLIDPGQLRDILKCFEDNATEMATLVIPVTDPNDLENESEVFVTMDKNKYALYFSRSVIPYVRGIKRKEWLQHATIYKHLGLYGYTINALKEFSSLPVSFLEKTESLEQNRWIEAGKKIKVGVTRFDSIPVDTAEDLERVRKIIGQKEGK